MPKPMYVWTGTAWVSVASEVESLATYATQSYADAQPGLKMVVPTSVAVGSGSGSVNNSGYVTFSGASSVSLNDVFSTTYDNYRITITTSSSGTTGAVGMRMRVSGSDNTSADYNFQRIYAQSGTTGGVRQTTFSYFELGYLTNNIFRTSLDLFSPFQTVSTTGNSIAGSSLNSSPELDIYVFGMDVTTSYTGLTIYPVSGGTITGNIAVYGYKKG